MSSAQELTQDTNSIMAAAEVFLSLIRKGLAGDTAAEEEYRDVDLREIYRFSVKHQLNALCFLPLEQADWFREKNGDLYQAWKISKEKAVRKSMLFFAEREAILQELSAKDVWHMPLKGSVLTQYYPTIGMRQMADQDILIDAGGAAIFRDLMVQRGYKVVSFGQSNHDIYEKDPVYNFEIHTSLFGSAHDPLWEDYFRNVKERLIQDTADGLGYHMSDEDFYIYITLHSYKHYSNSGTGLRSLVDCYVYQQAKSDTLDWAYLEAELKKLKIDAYEQVMRSLARKIFGENEVVQGEACSSGTQNTMLTAEEQELLQFLSGAGVYGKTEIRIGRSIQKLVDAGHISEEKAKRTYLRKRLFPDREWLKTNQPAVYKSKIGIPFFYVFRIVRGMALRSGQIIREWKIVKEKV